MDAWTVASSSSILLCTGLVVFVDADLRSFTAEYVMGLLGPLLLVDEVQLVNPIQENSCRDGNYDMAPEDADTFAKFLSNKVMLLRHINISYCWLVVAMVYYGLSMVSIILHVNW